MYGYTDDLSVESYGYAPIEAVPTRFYTPPGAPYPGPSRREATYLVPEPSRLGRAFGRVMWGVDDVRRAVAAKIVDWRTEPPRLRRIDGVLIWLVSAVATTISVLGGLEIFG